MIIEADIAPVKKRIASKTLLILFIILLVYFQVFLSRVTDLPFRLLFDVLVLVLAASVTASTIINFRIKISHLSFLLSVMLFTIISSLGALDPSLSKSVVSSIIFSKFILIFFLARYVTMSDLEPAIKVFAFIHVVGCLSSLLFPSFFQGLLPSTTYELDVSRLMGFSLNANRAAAASSVLLLYFVFYKRSLLTASLFFFLLLFSESRSVTFLVAIVFAFLILSARISVPKKIAVASFGIIVVLGFLSQFIAFEETVFKIENTLSGDLRYIRAAMLFGGWSLATEFFPFGVGGGMFGSSMSQGSAAYVIIGISHWSTVVDMTGVFDSGFGAILGEYGFLGLLIYVFLVYLTIKYALRARRPTLQVLFLVFLILYMSFFRTVASDFFFSLYFLFLFLLISDFCDRAKVNNHAYPPRP